MKYAANASRGGHVANMTAKPTTSAIATAEVRRIHEARCGDHWRRSPSVDQLMGKLQLDASSRALLKSIPIEDAIGVLDTLARAKDGNNDGIRNASAFVTREVTRTCNDTPCKFFARGRCDYGDHCRYSHSRA